jgi:hypothetical protein
LVTSWNYRNNFKSLSKARYFGYSKSYFKISPILKFRALEDGTINFYAGKKIHGWFFKVLKEADDELSSF